MHDKQRIVLVTGCTDGSAGSALARQFQRRGCRVFAAARSLDRMQSLADLDGLDRLAMDVTSAAQIADAVVAVRAATGGGRLDILVNNAAAFNLMPLADQNLDDARASTFALLFTYFVPPALVIQSCLSNWECDGPIHYTNNQQAPRTHTFSSHFQQQRDHLLNIVRFYSVRRQRLRPTSRNPSLPAPSPRRRLLLLRNPPGRRQHRQHIRGRGARLPGRVRGEQGGAFRHERRHAQGAGAAQHPRRGRGLGRRGHGVQGGQRAVAGTCRDKPVRRAGRRRREQGVGGPGGRHEPRRLRGEGGRGLVGGESGAGDLSRQVRLAGLVDGLAWVVWYDGCDGYQE